MFIWDGLAGPRRRCMHGRMLQVAGCSSLVACRPNGTASPVTVSSALAGAFSRLAILDWAWLIVLRSPTSAAHAPPRDGVLQLLRALIVVEVRACAMRPMRLCATHAASCRMVHGCHTGHAPLLFVLRHPAVSFASCRVGRWYCE